MHASLMLSNWSQKSGSKVELITRILKGQRFSKATDSAANVFHGLWLDRHWLLVWLIGQSIDQWHGMWSESISWFVYVCVCTIQGTSSTQNALNCICFHSGSPRFVALNSILTLSPATGCLLGPLPWDPAEEDGPSIENGKWLASPRRLLLLTWHRVTELPAHKRLH